MVRAPHHLFVVLLVCTTVAAHSYFTKPKPRVFNSDWGCRLGGPEGFIQDCHNIALTSKPEAGPCARAYSKSQPHESSSRGAPLRVEWPRNNHPGGFIRLAWLPADQTELPNAHALFDGNVQQYTCHEVHCQADSGPGGEGGDSLGELGENPCWLETTVPLHLTDGVWTLQWAWYGGGPYGYLGDYYSCANFNIQGGETGPQLAPVFKGGDVSNPNDKNGCKYWSSNRLHYCTREPCTDVCDDATAPAGHCGGKASRGAPYIDPLINGNPTSSTSQQPTQQPTQPPSTTTTSGGGDRPEIVVVVTVQVQVSVDVFDPTVFVYDVTALLNLPVAAVQKVEILLDQSTTEQTICKFSIVNAVDKNGNVVNPIDAAKQLKEIASQENSQVNNYSNLKGMVVVSSETDTASSASTFVVSILSTLIALAILY